MSAWGCSLGSVGLQVAGCERAGLAVDELTQPRRDGGEVLGDLGWGWG